MPSVSSAALKDTHGDPPQSYVDAIIVTTLEIAAAWGIEPPYSQTLTIGDEYEPDDSCGEAKPITPGSSQARTFDPAGDEDWIELAMTAGQSYAIQTGDLAGSADTILQLYASDCLVLLAENDDYEPDTLWSRIEWTATETASHYLRVRNYDPTIGGEGVSYSISVQQIP